MSDYYQCKKMGQRLVGGTYCDYLATEGHLVVESEDHVVGNVEHEVDDASACCRQIRPAQKKFFSELF